ncbi:MAG: peroxiredoxin [Nitrososphaerota archaeon]|jgi:peroxiredoxin|nr:peroxiredoxin [Nitrososphaerota archaeon]MDG6927873.1 peroxiredoxin [Nitrososphaerota archaeon]MDG6931018.1 peroxiredoxin [Nitrososphaerota archaeon]MDG6932122.1 peroxiredoxin [Nitrososphaerota archaeon]MDG6936677.1 peroxiredoxin [Nitrososphaerota archaeon]
MIKVNDIAVDFTLPDQDLKTVKLSDFKGSNVVLAFFPGAFTSVCTKEMCTFRDSMSRFNRINARVFGISVDSPFALKAFLKDNSLNFELLSDFNKNVSRTYPGLHRNFAKVLGLEVSKRSVFIIGKDFRVKYAWVSEDPGVEPKYSEIESVLNKLQ